MNSHLFLGSKPSAKQPAEENKNENEASKPDLVIIAIVARVIDETHFSITWQVFNDYERVGYGQFDRISVEQPLSQRQDFTNTTCLIIGIMESEDHKRVWIYKAITLFAS